MLSYVLLVGKQGQPVDPALVDRMARDDLPELAFVPEEFVHWKSPGGSVHVLCWQAFTEINGVESHWYIDGEGLTAFSGHLWPRETGWDWGNGSWAAQLALFYQTRGVLESVEDLFGVFTTLHLSREGEGFVSCDMLSGGTIYTAETATASIISSRAALAARAANPPGRPIERDVEGAGWVTFISGAMSRKTGFSLVETLPFRADVAIDPERGATVIRRPANYWDSSDYDLLPHRFEPITEHVERELRTAIRTLGSLPTESRQLRLSGGRDSRLIAALIILEGLQDRFEFFTYGLAHSPDIIAARNIASELGLNWHGDIRDAPATAEAFAQQMRVHAFQTAGMCPGWTPKGTLTITPGITATGNYSELLRFGLMSAVGLAAGSFDEAHRLVLSRAAHISPGFMRPDARAAYLARLYQWMLELAAGGIDLSRMSSMFIPQVQARWTYSSPTEVNTRVWTFPLYTPAAARSAQHLPAPERFTERFHFDIILKASEMLAKMPLNDKGWLPETYAHLPNAQEFAMIPPVRYEGPGTIHWRVAHFDAHRPVFVQFLSDPQNPVYELVDYHKIQKILASPTSSYGVRMFLDNVLVTAMWLNGDDLPARISRTGDVNAPPRPEQPIQIRSLEFESPVPVVPAVRPAPDEADPMASDTSAGRLLLVDQEFPSPYGAHAADLFLNVLANGWDAHLTSSSADPASWSLYPEIAQNSWLRSRIAAGADPSEQIRRLKPDLILFTSCLLAAEHLPARRSGGARIVVIVHGEDLELLAHDARMFDTLWPRTDAWVVRRPSDWQRCLDAGFSRDIPEFVIPLGVDCHLFEPDSRPDSGPLGDPGTPLRLLSVGRLEWDRGHVFAIDAVKILRRFGVGTELSIIGEGPLRDALAFEIDAAGLGRCVSLRGPQSRQAVREAMDRADVYLQTSLRPTEALSTSEAQSMRLPVVAFNLQRQLLSLREGVSSFIVEPRDAFAMAERLTMLAADPALRLRLGNTGRSHVSQNFTIEQETAKLASVFHRCLDRQSQARALMNVLRSNAAIPAEPDLAAYLHLEEAFAHASEPRR